MNKKNLGKIKQTLDRLYIKYNYRRLVKPDPLQFVYYHSTPNDIEIAAFLSSCLAYGRVEQIEKSLTNLFERLDNKPYEFTRSFKKSKRQQLKDFKHRFTSGDDIADLLELLQWVYDKFGSIEKCFIEGYNRQDKNIVPALSNFCSILLNRYAQKNKGCTPKGLRYLLVSPEDGSTCKRMNLFLRWLVRKDNIDIGLWESVDKSKLIVPVDTHMARLCKILGFYSGNTINLKTALEITNIFAKIESKDPLKFDFALSRIGILENCNGRYRKQCDICELLGFCFNK